jgi:NAD(P)-dependent dehydrogenase (short-subunit alcohol dehydrogenase family)
MDLNGRVALVTGGSRGLGLLLARRLGERGARVMIAARDQAELDNALQDLQSRGIDAATVVADVGHKDDARRMVQETVNRFGRLDVLVNNAGIITVGPMDNMTAGDFEDAMDVHFWGPFHSMRAAIPHMLQNGAGRIVNISSIGGKIAVPHLAPYCASKFALAGLSASFQLELARDDIFVTTVFPGLMRTGSPFNARFKGEHRAEFAWFAIADSLPVLSIDGQRAAAQIVDALESGEPELVITWPAQLAAAAAALIPDTLARTMTVVNRLLPESTDAHGGRTFTGWQSTSNWAPSSLTRSSERAAERNNEIPGPRTAQVGTA